MITNALLDLSTYLSIDNQFLIKIPFEELELFNLKVLRLFR